MLRDALHLVADTHALYLSGNSQVRRNLNHTFFQKLYIDDCEVTHDVLKPIFAELAETKRTMLAVAATNADMPESFNNNKTAPPGLAGVFGQRFE